VKHEKAKVALYLNIPMIQVFCEEMNMSFMETLEKLEMIHQELDGRNNP
jgi:hypothetical protein